MEDLEQLDIKEILESLEKGYDIIESNLNEEQEDFLGIGDSIVEVNTLPDIDYKLALSEYLVLLKKEV